MPQVEGDSNDPDYPAVLGQHTGGGSGVYGESNSRTDEGPARPAIHGLNTGSGIGVYGESNSATNENGAGVFGVNTQGGPGVWGFADTVGPGVKGTSQFTGVEGESIYSDQPSEGPGRDHAWGVRGKTNGTGASGRAAGVRGEGNNYAPGIWGEGSTGVYGQGRKGPGVHGESEEGYGGEFDSKNSSQLRLSPRDAQFGGAASSGQPQPIQQPVLPDAASAGELRLVKDDQGVCSLWLCVHGASSRPSSPAFQPASWAQVLLGESFFGSITL